jgi:hypothetical protein
MIFTVQSNVEGLNSGWQMHLNEEEKNSARRLLRRLRIALIVWLFAFLISIVWFTLSAMS